MDFSKFHSRFFSRLLSCFFICSVAAAWSESDDSPAIVESDVNTQQQTDYVPVSNPPATGVDREVQRQEIANQENPNQENLDQENPDQENPDQENPDQEIMGAQPPDMQSEVIQSATSQNDDSKAAIILETGVLPTQNEDVDEPGRLKNTRDYLGNGYRSLSEKLDRFIGGSYLENEHNDSKLAVYTSNSFWETGHTQADVKLKASVDLPNTAQRFRIFVESDPDETNTLQERTRPISRGDDVERETSVVGLEFSKPRALTTWKTSASLGARFNSGVKPLVRLRARKYWQLTPVWQAYFRQDLWHLESVGWGETSRVEFTRAISETSRFQTTIELEYRDEDDPLAYANVYHLFHRANDNIEMVYSFGLLGEGSTEKMWDDHFVNMTLKYRLYEDWIFLDFTPELFFAEENQCDPEASFTVTLKVWLTN